MGRAVVDRTPVHVHDFRTAADEFPDGQAHGATARRSDDPRVPLLRENEAIGAIALRRAEVEPFSRQADRTAQTFADQAVIAIENVGFSKRSRRARASCRSRWSTRPRPPRSQGHQPLAGDLQPVFDTMLETAAALRRLRARSCCGRGRRLTIAAHAGRPASTFRARRSTGPSDWDAPACDACARAHT